MPIRWVRWRLKAYLPVTAETALVQLAKLAAWTAQNYPTVTAVGVDTSVYHHAGATAVQDIGYGAATGVEYLRAMTAAGMEIDEAARQIEFNISLGTHHFLAIAKLRAARRIWSRIVEASGGSQAVGVMRINAVYQPPRADAARSVRESVAQYRRCIRGMRGGSRFHHVGAIRCDARTARRI